MKNLILILIVLLAVQTGFGQDLQLTKDFIQDKDGSLGLRANYIKKVPWGKYGRYEFNGLPLYEFIKGKSKQEIIELLGTPNEYLDFISTNNDGNDNVVPDHKVKVIQIVYLISHSDKKCNNTYSESPTHPRNAEDYEKDKIKYITIEYFYDCADKNKKDKVEQVVKLIFSFYLDDKK
jgi:hypothetical protein